MFTHLYTGGVMDESAKRRAEARRWLKAWLKPIWPTRLLVALAIGAIVVFAGSLFYQNGRGHGQEQLLTNSVTALCLMLLAAMLGLVHTLPVKENMTLQLITNCFLYMMVGAWMGIGIYLILTP